MQEEIIFPLHPAQQDVYTDQLLDTKSPHYNIGGYIKLKGSLNKKLFYEAVGSGAKVFDAFRMRFDWNLEEPVIFMDTNCDNLLMSDLDFSNNDNGEQDAIEWMQSRFNTPFVFEKEALLYEQNLIKISNEEYWFYGKYHHLITDGYGFIVWVQYVANKYKSLVDGDEKEFAFSNYTSEAIKAIEYKNSPAYLEDGNYWGNNISVKPKKILQEKYFNFSSNKSETYFLTLTEDQRKKLDDITEVTKIRLHHLTIAALFIYFGKTSKESTFYFGIPVHKRSSREAKNIVGIFSGIMPYKNSFRENITLPDLFKEILRTQKEDYKYQNYQVGDLARSLKVKPNEGYLFDVVINYKLLNFVLSFGQDVEATIYELTNEFLKYPLQLCWQDFGKQQPLRLQLDYGTRFFTRKDIELLAQRFIYILEQFPQSINKEIGSIDIVPPFEKELISKFNKGEAQPYTGKNIIGLFESQALTRPEEVALIFEDKKLTYKELNTRANQLAHFLLKQGVKKETLVPICIERGVDMVVGLLGILKAGGTFIPVDPDYPVDRIEYMLQDSRAQIILTSKQSHEKLSNITGINCIEIDEVSLNINKESTQNPGIEISPDQLCYIIYTSGSTGNPKGVMIEQKSVVNLLESITTTVEFTRSSTFLSVTTFSFDISYLEIFMPLVNGGKLIIVSRDISLDGYKLSETISALQPTHMQATPTTWQLLLEAKWGNNERIKMLIGGEAVKEDIKENLALKGDLYNLYGPTETTIWSSVKKLQTGEKVLIGKPINNTTIYIVDGNMENVPVGEIGEICIGGVGLARGYYNREKLTKEKFVENPFTRENNLKLYRTGDLGRWQPDGNIECLGRVDDQVKIRGYRIELGEIEALLLKNDMIKQAVVLAKEDKQKNKRLVGYLVVDNVLDKEALSAYLKTKLPSYMIPAIWVEMPEFPLTPNGKIDKKAFPAPEDSALVSNQYTPPVNDLEEKLVSIWQEILSVEKIGTSDSFFDLGGHSLNAMQLTSRLHKLLNIKIDIGKIFANPTIKELALVLSAEAKNVYTAIEKLPHQEYYDLSHAQKRFWILSHYKDGSKAYNFAAAFVIDGYLNKIAFDKAVQMVIERHENLRTVFVEIDGEPRQKILSAEEFQFQIKHIVLLDNENVHNIISDAKEIELSHSYDLAEGPLFRISLFNLSDKKNILLFSIHHIISDGWSKGILINEILSLYKTYCSGLENNLPALPIQYKDYAAWHTTHIKDQHRYWSGLVNNSIPVLDFPTDFERPKVLSFLGNTLHKKVPEALTLDLHKLATSHNMSLNNLLFSLYGLLVSQYSGQSDVVIGSLSSGRSHIDLENLIGAFINFLPVRVLSAKDLNLSEYLENTNRSLVETYKHQDYPFDLMVDELIKKRDFSRNPFFDTMVNFHSENGMKTKGNATRKNISGAEININPYEPGEEEAYQSVLDFKLDIEPFVSELNFFLSYNSKLYSRERMEIFLDNFIELLAQVVSNPGKQLQDYNNLTFEKEGLRNMIVNADDVEEKTLQVYICSSFVAEPLQEYLEYWNKELELNIQVSFAPYNQVFQQLLDPASLLNTNNGLNVLFIRLEDWLRDKSKLTTKEKISFLDINYVELIAAIENLNKNAASPFLVGIVPAYSKASQPVEVIEQIKKLEDQLQLAIGGFSKMNFIEMDNIAGLYEVNDLYDDKADEVGHMPFTQEYYAAIGTYLARKIKAFKGPSYKVIALDCDNTLWKGVCGEVGAMNVTIDENFSGLQKFFLEKYSEGFLLVLCSKNNEEDVWEVFNNHPKMILKREHITTHKINWDIKSKNLAAISKELNLGIDSFIFIDDSGFEIEQMETNCPDILSIHLPEEVNTFSDFLNHIWAFDTFSVTEEDTQRNKRYKVEKDRNAEQEKHRSVSDFIASLNIKVNIIPLDESNIERAVQLSLRTNQFNLNGIRKTRDEILKSIGKKNSYNSIIEVSDRFGDYGIVGLVIAEEIDNCLVVETFLLSCRVLGRNVEDEIISGMQDFCTLRELRSIQLLFTTTQKNMPFQEFISRSGWLVDSKTNNYHHELLSQPGKSMRAI